MARSKYNRRKRFAPASPPASPTQEQEANGNSEYNTLLPSMQSLPHAKRFRSLVLALATAQIAWITDAQGKLVEAPEWVDFTGQTQADVEAGNWLAYVHPEDQAQVMSTWKHSLNTRSRFDAEYRLRKQDGTYEHFEVHGVPLLNADGTIHEWVGTSANVTAHKQAKVTVERLQERLRFSIMEMDHRVKNNLQIISALVETPLADTSEATLRRVSQYTQALTSLHDLLARAAMESGAESDALSVRTILDQLLPLLQARAGKRHIIYKAEDVLSPVQHIASITLLVNELVSNAIEYGAGEIELTFEVNDNQARLEVCDDGPGFPPGFEPLHSAKTGLQLVHSTICHDLRGQVWFTNRPEGGAKVVVEFPFPQHVE